MQLPWYLIFPQDENSDVSIDPTKMKKFDAHLGEKIFQAIILKI